MTTWARMHAQHSQSNVLLIQVPYRLLLLNLAIAEKRYRTTPEAAS
jgi:hypothetical protein